MWEGPGLDGHLRHSKFQCKGWDEVSVGWWGQEGGQVWNGQEETEILVLLRPELLSVLTASLHTLIDVC